MLETVLHQVFTLLLCISPDQNMGFIHTYRIFSAQFKHWKPMTVTKILGFIHTYRIFSVQFKHWKPMTSSLTFAVQFKHWRAETSPPYLGGPKATL